VLHAGGILGICPVVLTSRLASPPTPMGATISYGPGRVPDSKGIRSNDCTVRDMGREWDYGQAGGYRFVRRISTEKR